MKRTKLAKWSLCLALSTMALTCGDHLLPALRLWGPHDRDVCLVDYPATINWQAIETGPEIRIELYRDGLGGASEVIGTFPAKDDSQPWTVTAPTSVNCILEATDTTDPALTAVTGVFRIVGPGLYVQGPHLSDSLVPGDTVTVRWYAPAAMQASIADVRIELSRDGGVTWEELVASVPVTDGFVSWTVTDGGLPLPQPDCQFRVSEVGNPTTFDVSLSFSIE